MCALSSHTGRYTQRMQHDTLAGTRKALQIASASNITLSAYCCYTIRYYSLRHCILLYIICCLKTENSVTMHAHDAQDRFTHSKEKIYLRWYVVQDKTINLHYMLVLLENFQGLLDLISTAKHFNVALLVEFRSVWIVSTTQTVKLLKFKLILFSVCLSVTHNLIFYVLLHLKF